MTIHTRDTELRQNVLIASYSQYDNAERAVDVLSDYGFPARKMSIVGRGLEWVEQVNGRLTAVSAARRGAASGALAGAVVGWLSGWFDWTAALISWLLLTVYGSVLGALAGALVGWLAHRSVEGRRDSRPAPSFRAQTYDVFVDIEHAEQATAALRSVSGPDARPRHGTTATDRGV